MNIYHHTFFCICLFESVEHSYSVVLTSHLTATLKQQKQRGKLVYLRVFYEMQEAVAYKLLMEQMSVHGLRSQVRSINPLMKDMAPLIEQLYRKE